MEPFRTRIAALEAEGYANGPAQAKLAHDIVLAALAMSGAAPHVAVKGGVLMGSLTGDVRRATMDLDIDFVRRPLSDESVDGLVRLLNRLDGVSISRRGPIVELRQRNYRGKRIHLDIRDAEGAVVTTKIDIGVHVHAEMPQPLHPFAVSVAPAPVRLPANTREQVFAEKLKSLLRLGARSNRPKDVFDMYYLRTRVDGRRLRRFVALLVFDDSAMRERDFAAVAARVRGVFSSGLYRKKLAGRKANWLEITPDEAMSGLLSFLETLQPAPAAKRQPVSIADET